MKLWATELRFGNATVEVTQQGLTTIVEYLASIDGQVAQNTMMIERLQTSFEAGEALTGADANFYLHELYEASLVADGMEQEAAHLAALAFYSHSPYSIYAPEIIQTLRSSFNSNWFRYWGLPL